jgi:hypothetical protein
MDIQLGRLERVDLRAAWQTEDGDFTNWLAEEENLALLGETLSLELELEGTEKRVGPFRADILCKDTADGSWVLVENQLERTDHDHLGKLMTYAAGLEAVTVVWIARNFTDEHRAALDWLNQITAEQHNFFGLEIELWCIGTSAKAPKFNVISKPNDWTKNAAIRGTVSEELTGSQQLWLDYWTAMMEVVKAAPSQIRPRKPLAQGWHIVSIGRSGFVLVAETSLKEQRIGVQLALDSADAKAHFQLLLAQRAEIEADLGTSLEWRELPDKKTSRIMLRKGDTNIENEEDWPAQHEWLLNSLNEFYRVFAPRVKRLDADRFVALHDTIGLDEDLLVEVPQDTDEDSDA